jgi:alkylhydroperoxidase family enzyme
VTDDPLRFRSAADTDGDVQRVLHKLEESGSANQITRLLANSPNGFRPYVLMSRALLVEASLPRQVRELVILRMASHIGVPYELSEHRGFADRAGVSDERQLAAISPSWHSSDLFSDSERLALAVTMSLLDSVELEVARWHELCREWGEQGALDLLLTIGWWGGFMPLVLRGLSAHGLDT